MGLGIVFSGQGNQNPTMFKMLAASQQVQSDLLKLEEILGYRVIPDIGLGEEELFHNSNAQPLIAGLGYLQWKILQDKLPLPVAFAGYSLGELTAYAAAGACNFNQLIQLGIKRANLMDQAAACSAVNSLVAVSGIGEVQLRESCREFDCFPSIQNSSENWVVGGVVDNLTRLTQNLLSSSPCLKITPLKVNVASHTPLLSSAAREFIDYLQADNWHELIAPVVASVNAATVYTFKDGITLLGEQIAQTVHFSQSIAVMQELGASVILELGAGSALSKIIDGLNLGVTVRSINEFASFDGCIRWVLRNLE